ncbi:MAG: cytochrome c oxidase subunit II [Calditrichaeota bacterium]|nr:cytochrome c oxidase subunit II [Calditrichota bacterium]RQV98835.1 MAG: cytochrome c oxidase subunit II [Calditrichota bacterium]
MSGASPTTGAVDSVFIFIVAISLFFLVLITFLMIYFIIKYNKKRHAKAEDIHGNTTLEIIWTVIPTIIVLFMFYFGWKGFEFIRNAPEDSMEVSVTARMWSWLFEYPNGVETDTLYVPVNTPIKLLLNSQDVIHSFYVPAFRIKEDAVPGLQNYLWFEVSKIGEYDVLCAEYCGLQHAYMLTKVKAMPQEKFEEWYEQMRQETQSTYASSDSTQMSIEASPKTSMAGSRLVQTRGCMACHSTDGSKMIGPTFQGLFGREVVLIEDEKEITITADESYIRESIMQPNKKLVKGYNPLMPSQEGQLSDEELNAIVEYLKKL